MDDLTPCTVSNVAVRSMNVVESLRWIAYQLLSRLTEAPLGNSSDAELIFHAIDPTIIYSFSPVEEALLMYLIQISSFSMIIPPLKHPYRLVKGKKGVSTVPDQTSL